MDYRSVADLIRERERKFVESRTIIANEITRYTESLKQMDENLLKQYGIDINQTPQSLLPALWQEPFNEVEYTKQLTLLQQQINAIRACCDRLNEEALKCLQ